MPTDLLNTLVVERFEDGHVADPVAGKVDVGGAQDKGMIALITAGFQKCGRLGIGASYDDAGHVHDIELEAARH